MKVAVASSSRLALPSVAALQVAGHEIVGAISNPDLPSGRGQRITPNDFAQAIRSTQISLFQPASHSELSAALNACNPDLVVVIAYGRLIRKSELSVPAHGWINLHFSLLPKYRGAAPVQRSILDGSSETGITVFQLDEGMDTGPIYVQERSEIGENENSGDVLDRLSHRGASAIVRAIQMIEEGISPYIQSDRRFSLAPKIDKSELRIDWSRSAIEISRQIRAFSPSPGAWTNFRGQRFVISRARQCETLDLKPGQIQADSTLLVGTGAGSIEIESLTPAGKKSMEVADWLRGARISSNESFE